MKKTFKLWDKKTKQTIEVEAKKAGREWKATCPKHDDKNPSLSINEEESVYHCFGCDWSGPLYKPNLQQSPVGKTVTHTPSKKQHTQPPPIPETQIQGYIKNLSDEKIQSLREVRGLTKEIIDHYKIGWCEEKQRFTIPIHWQGKYVNVRLYHPSEQPKILPISSGRSIQLYPEDQLSNNELYLCEGELDALCAISRGLPAITITGGARSWKDEFTPLFKGKKVNIVYDCDKTGREGAKKIAKTLSEVAQIKIVDLGLKEGKDLTDWFVEYGKTKEDLYRLNNPDLHNVIEVTKKWLYLEDYTIIEVTLAAIIAHRLEEADPFWLFVISPSGGSKTELFRALKGEDTYELSDLTEHTLVSGQKQKKGPEPSLLPKLTNKILIMKDFTTVLSMRYEERLKILATLREIYDGYIDKTFGTGKHFHWEGKVGFIAGVTPAIDKHYGVMGLLGPRFIQYRMKHHNRREETRKAMENMGKEKEMRRELNATIRNFLSNIGSPEGVTISKDFSEKILDLADYTATLRSEVSRNGRTKEIEFLPEPEVPTRLSKCYRIFIQSLSVVRGKEEATKKEYEVLKQIAKDSIPSRRNVTIEALYKMDEWMTTQELGEKTKLPTTTARYILEDLYALKFISRRTPRENLVEWRISEEKKTMLQNAGVYTNTKTRGKEG